jgi:hypothetical protein
MDWRSDQRLSELWSIVEMAGECEELPIAALKSAAEEFSINTDGYIAAWEGLCKEGWALIEKAEQEMGYVH